MVLCKAELIASLQNEVRLAAHLASKAAAPHLDYRPSAAQHAEYADLLAGRTDADFRAEVTDFDGSKTSRGAFLTNLVLGGCAAYRMQLFLYLKATSAPTINSANLWSGMDTPTQA